MAREIVDESQELTILREAVHRAAKEKVGPIASSIDELGEFNRDVENLCWDLGLLTLALPSEFGGLDKNTGTALCIAVEELARFCASSALLLIIQAVGSYPYRSRSIWSDQETNSCPDSAGTSTCRLSGD